MKFTFGLFALVALSVGCAPAEKEAPASADSYESLRQELRDYVTREQAEQRIVRAWTDWDRQHRYASWKDGQFVFGSGFDQPETVDFTTADYVGVEKRVSEWFYRVVVGFSVDRSPLQLRADSADEAAEVIRALVAVGATR